MSDNLERNNQVLWTKAFIVLTTSSFLLSLCLQMLMTPLPAYVKDQFNPGDFMISLVTSVFAISAILSRFLTASLMRKIHRNILLFAGVLIAAIATIAYPYANSIFVMLLLRVLFGIGFGMGTTVMPTMVVQIIPRRRIGEGIGYFGLSSSLAMSFGPLIGLTMLDGFGFTTLSLTGAFSVILIIPLLLFTPSIPKAQPIASPSEVQAEKKMPFPIKLLIPAFLNVLLSITYGGILSFIALYGKELHLENIGLFFLFNAVAILLIRPISGKLFDSKGPAAIMLLGSIVIIISLFILSNTTNMLTLIISALLYGLGFGSIQPALQGWLLKDTHPSQHGIANSLFYNAIDLGVAFGAMTLGIIASQTSYSIMYRYSSAFMLLFLLLYGIVQFLAKKKATPSKQ